MTGDTGRAVMTCIEIETSNGETTEEGLGPRVDAKDVKRLVSQGRLMEMLLSENVLVRRSSRDPVAALTGTQDSTISCLETSR